MLPKHFPYCQFADGPNVFVSFFVLFLCLHHEGVYEGSAEFPEVVAQGVEKFDVPLTIVGIFLVHRGHVEKAQFGNG